jgi:hypothetical protein
MFAPCINSIKNTFIVPTDAHRNVKTILKIIFAPTCFGSRRNHHQGAVLCLAKTTKWFFPCSSVVEAVNVMAAYQPVTQA